MRLIKPAEFTGDRAWDALDVERFDAATVRLHWTDQPYIWHVNDGPEVFVLLSGSVRMHVRRPDGGEEALQMSPGDVFHAEDGDAHKAEPLEASHILVIERPGSV